MAYTTGTMSLMASSIEGKPPNIWSYVTSDGLTGILAPNYVNNAAFKGMQVGDFVIGLLSGLTYLLQVGSMVAGEATLTAISTPPSSALPTIINAPRSVYNVLPNDSLIEVQAAVPSIVLPDGTQKIGPVTIIGAAAGFFGTSNATVTVAGGKLIGGQASFVFSNDFGVGTFLPLTSGAYGLLG